MLSSLEIIQIFIILYQYYLYHSRNSSLGRRFPRPPGECRLRGCSKKKIGAPAAAQMVLNLPQGPEDSEYVLSFEIGQREGGFYSARTDTPSTVLVYRYDLLNWSTYFDCMYIFLIEEQRYLKTNLIEPAIHYQFERNTKIPLYYLYRIALTLDSISNVKR